MYRFVLIYILAFAEGVNLMAFELISSRTMTIGFGSTLTVWSTLLSCTLLFLALGYYFGGLLSLRFMGKLRLFFYLLIAITSLYFYFYIPISKHLINQYTLSNSFMSMVLFTCLLIGFPIIIFGITTPLLISIFPKINFTNNGHIAGKIYAISTLGGVLSTFLFGLYLIPLKGLEFSSSLISILLLLSLPIFLILKKSIDS